MTWLLLALAALADPDAPLQPPAEVQPEDPQSPPTPDPADHTTLVWQGFDHVWQRKVLGAWVLPHRVSLFRTGPVDEHHETRDGAIHTEATWRFAQSTGVDGDFMVPQGYASRVTAPDVQTVQGTTRFSTVDEAMGAVPRAFARFHDAIRLERTMDDSHAVAVLRGLSFRSACMDEADQCNSHGIWPYRFGVELAPCLADGGAWICPVSVDVGRAWTPHRGGIKGIEEKPLNEHMAIDIEIDWVVFEGSSEHLASTSVVFENALGSNRQMHLPMQTIPVPVVGGDRYPEATVGLSSFAFQFFPTSRRSADVHRGRYIGGWAMRLRRLGYDSTEGLFALGHAGGILIPRTVRQTGVSIELGLTVVQLGGEEAEVVELDPLLGRICSNSHGAPFYSTWRRCERRSGSEQTEDTVPVHLER